MRHYPLITDLFPCHFATSDFGFRELMKTDIRDKKEHYEFSIEVPGLKKDEIKIELKDEYLIVSAETDLDKEEKDKNGEIIYQERKHGSQSRSFFLGKKYNQEDVKAKFENGLLVIELPKESKKEVEATHYIPIE